MKTYAIISENTIVRVLDCRDERYEIIIENIDLTGYTEIEVSEAQLDAIVAGEKFDYVGGRVVPHTPTAAELAEALQAAKTTKIQAIAEHDSSDAVNQFFANGLGMWLDRNTRTAVARTVEIDKNAGRPTSTMWYNEVLPPVRFDLPVNAMEQMLAVLEDYAKDTFNVTQAHIAAVCELETVEAVEQYDFAAGYPEKLQFTF